ncbi:MAG: zinc-ribbon domain-containing protein [Candidatus Tectomicrobia bacterium]|nr:zinc-ribbon domain-containing protein [Candidatus Tectomicrobia bacterium]
MMKTCPSCGTELRQRYRFCHECGENVEDLDVDITEEEARELRKSEFWIGIGCFIFVLSAVIIIIGFLFFSYR